MRKASIKETGEELSQEEWARFDRAIAETRAERRWNAELFEHLPAEDLRDEKCAHGR